MELGELWDRLISSPEVLAALLGALVGGVASGLAALGGSVLVEKMKRRKTVRIRMYEESFPSIRDAASEYRAQVVEGEAPEPLPVLLQQLTRLVADLDHISAMAGRRDRQLVRRIRAGQDWAGLGRIRISAELLRLGARPGRRLAAWWGASSCSWPDRLPGRLLPLRHRGRHAND